MKKAKQVILGFFVLLAVGFIACNDTADTTDTTDDTVGRVDNPPMDTTARSDDAKWVSEVLESNYAEVALAQQAQNKATTKSIKDLAAMLEKDHKALIDEAKDLASKKNWTVATAETSDDMRKREDRMDDEVKEYEKDWLESMADRHEKSIRKFEDASDDNIDADLKTWVNATLPKLRAHHEKIEQLQKNMK